MNRLSLALFFLLLPSLAQAQTPTLVILAPSSGITFTASPDHAAAVGTGAAAVPKVSSYRLDIALLSAPATVVSTVPLGKPTPATDGTIAIKPFLAFAALAEGVYVSTVVVVGPSEEARSAASDPFVRVGPPRATGKPTVVP